MTSLALQSPGITTPSFEQVATVLKASGDALRLEILRVLARECFGVLELSRLFDIKQSGMSHHLKVLSNAGLVETQREGNSIFYRRAIHRAEQNHHQLILSLFGEIDQLPVNPSIAQRMQHIRNQRAEQSQAFFTRHADAFREQQELIADHDQYAEPVARLLKAIPAEKRQHVLEVGPGEGDFLPTLSALFARVTALDNSTEMLSRAKTLVDKHQLTDIRFVCGELATLAEPEPGLDVIVMNMVLHHVPSPADMFSEAARYLKPGGRLLISDLCHHQQNWVRENCGDLWMGFETEELDYWAEQAQLAIGNSLFIGLRNGFQIQVREFLAPV